MQNGTIIIRDQRLRMLHSIFCRWVELNKRYCCERERDAPYWSSERANTGVLAAAAWMEGGLALEEYPSTKIGKTESDEVYEYTGRTDLWIKPRDGKPLIVEAKFTYLQLRNDDQHDFRVEWVSDRLKSACLDAEKARSKELDAVGLVFVVPYLDREERGRADGLIASLCEGVLESCPSLGALVVARPPAASELGWPRDSETSRHYYPGVMAIAEVVEQEGTLEELNLPGAEVPGPEL